MSDRPIPFSAPMVAALLAGTKTQTRRALPAQPARRVNLIRVEGRNAFFCDGDHPKHHSCDEHAYPIRFSYQVGDRLYVRESYYQLGHWEPVEGKLSKGGRQKWAFTPDADQILFDAPAGETIRLGRHHKDPSTVAWHKRLGRFMAKKHSRLTLIVTDVRVERLQDISEADAIAEGIEDVTREVASGDKSLRFWKRYKDGGWNGYVDTAVGSYASLWTEINGPGTWEANPWVAAYTFTVRRGNINQIGGAA